MKLIINTIGLLNKIMIPFSLFLHSLFRKKPFKSGYWFSFTIPSLFVLLLLFFLFFFGSLIMSEEAATTIMSIIFGVFSALIFFVGFLYYFLIIEYESSYHKEFVIPIFKSLKTKNLKLLFLNAVMKKHVGNNYINKVQDDNDNRYDYYYKTKYDKIKNDFEESGISINVQDFTYMSIDEELKKIEESQQILLDKKHKLINKLKTIETKEKHDLLIEIEEDLDNVFEIKNT